MIGTDEERELTGKIKPDRRRARIKTLRMGIFLMLVAAVCVSVYIYRSDLNMDNLRRVFQYVGAGANGTELSGSSIPLETGLNSIVKPFQQGIAVLNSDTLRFVNAAGKEDMDIQLGYARPVLLTGEKLMIAYDRGGNGYCVSNSYSALKNEKLESPIVSMSMNEKGYYAVVTNETGYRAAVALFDDKQEELYKWYTSAYYVTLSAISPAGKSFSAVCMSEENGVFASFLILFDADSEEPIARIRLGEDFVLGISYADKDTLCVVTEKGAILFSGNGEEKGRTIFESGLIAFVAEPGAPPVLISEQRLGGGILVTAIGTDGQIRGERAIQGDIRYISAAGKYTAMMVSDTIYLLNDQLEDTAPPFEAAGVRGIAAGDTGKIIAVFSDRAETYS